MSKDFQQNQPNRLSVALLEKPITPQLRRELPWWLRRTRYIYIRFLRLRGKPKEIALGLAIGVFSGCFPLFGVQMIFAILVAALLRANKLVAAAGTWISNPITYVPLFLFNFKVGRLFLPWLDLSVDELYLQSDTELMESGLAFVFTLLCGCIIVGSVASIATYFLALRLINRWRNSSKSEGETSRL